MGYLGKDEATQRVVRSIRENWDEIAGEYGAEAFREMVSEGIAQDSQGADFLSDADQAWQGLAADGLVPEQIPDEWLDELEEAIRAMAREWLAVTDLSDRCWDRCVEQVQEGTEEYWVSRTATDEIAEGKGITEGTWQWESLNAAVHHAICEAIPE